MNDHALRFGVALSVLAACEDRGAPDRVIDKLGDPVAIACPSDSRTAFVADVGLSALVEMDRMTGALRFVSAEAVIGDGPLLLNPLQVDVLASAGPAVVLTDDSVLGIDLKTGNRHRLADLTTKGDPALMVPSDAALTPDGARLIVADENAGVVEITLATGQRRLVTGLNTYSQSSDRLGVPTGLAVRDQVAWVTQQGRDSIAGVDLSTGAVTRELYTQGGWIPMDVAWSPDASEMLVVAGSGGPNHGIWRVRADTGEQTIVSTDERGGGPRFAAPQKFCVDFAAQRAFVLDGPAKSLFAVDLVTGDRTVFASW